MQKMKTEQKETQEMMKMKRNRAFEIFTLREFSQFERVQIETITSDEMMNSETAFVVHRADSVSDKERDKERSRERKRARKREFIIAVEKRENVIFEADEKESKEREKDRDRSSD
jgi:hypothetical protein